MSRSFRSRLLGTSGLLVFLVAWQVAVNLHMVSELLLSSPLGVVSAGARELQTSSFWKDVSTSGQEYVYALILAGCSGIVIGVLVGMFRRLDYMVDPWLTILNTMPTIAVAPMFIIIFGIDLSAKVAIIFLFAVFPVAVNVRAGVHATSSKYLRVARSCSATRWKTVRTVILPGALPYMVTGLRVGAGRAVIGIVAAEFIASDAGIGYRLGVASAGLRTGAALFLILLIGLSGLATSALFKKMEAALDRWRPVKSGG